MPDYSSKRRARIRHFHVVFSAALALVCSGPSQASEDEDSVRITGGTVDTGNHYSWTVTNTRESPIVHIEFPHYRATLFFAPEGWSTTSTNLVEIGAKDAPGVCTAEADSPAAGIQRGESAQFRMQVGDARAKPRPGTVRIRFGDGEELSIDGVEVPLPETVGDKYMTLIGLSAIFLIWMLIAGLRRRSKSNKQPDTVQT